jgi:hypothetical protein
MDVFFCCFCFNECLVQFTDACAHGGNSRSRACTCSGCVHTSSHNCRMTTENISNKLVKVLEISGKFVVGLLVVVGHLEIQHDMVKYCSFDRWVMFVLQALYKSACFISFNLKGKTVLFFCFSSVAMAFESKLKSGDFCSFCFVLNLRVHAIVVVDLNFDFWPRLKSHAIGKMSAEEEDKDPELKDLVLQVLDANGVLGKLKVGLILSSALEDWIDSSVILNHKAQIRANVFKALDESKNASQSRNRTLTIRYWSSFAFPRRKTSRLWSSNCCRPARD